MSCALALLVLYFWIWNLEKSLCAIRLCMSSSPYSKSNPKISTMKLNQVHITLSLHKRNSEKIICAMWFYTWTYHYANQLHETSFVQWHCAQQLLIQKALGKSSFVQLDCTQHLPLVQMDFSLITSPCPYENALSLAHISFTLNKMNFLKSPFPLFKYFPKSKLDFLRILLKTLSNEFLWDIICFYKLKGS